MLVVDVHASTEYVRRGHANGFQTVALVFKNLKSLSMLKMFHVQLDMRARKAQPCRKRGRDKKSHPHHTGGT